MNELSKKGGQPSRPVRYAVLWNNSFYQGIVTQRNPLRSNLGHIEEEFYGNQICFIDGLNAEISSKLTPIRRPGTTVWNSNTFPSINRFYENRTNIYNGSQTFSSELIQVVCDTASIIYDCTGPSTKAALFTKTTGAGSTYFQSVGNSLYFTDGPDRKKLITPSLVWAANQQFQVGNQILDSNGNLQVVVGATAATISEISVVRTKLGIPLGPYHYYIAVTFTSDVYWTAGTPVTFSGVTTYTSINGQTLPVVVNPTYLTPSANVAYFPSAIPTLYGPATDTGTATSTTSTGGGESGATVPVWNVSLAGTTTDNQLEWQNFGPPVFDWATVAPAQAPALIPVAGNRQWTPTTPLTEWYSVLDSNNNIQTILTSYGAGTTGMKVPVWNSIVPAVTSHTFGGVTMTNSIPPNITQDGSVQWINCGQLGGWVASTVYPFFQSILDSNGNIQVVLGNNGSGNEYGLTGSSAPSWATSIGTTTTDNGTLWVCVGPGSIIFNGESQYAYSWVSTDGSVTTASDIVQQNYGTSVLGPAGNGRAQLTGMFPTDPQIAFAWLWRTVQGGSVLFFDQAIPNPTPGTASSWYVLDVVPDTSLNELIEAPIDDENDPPPVGLTALSYHLGCVWGALGNELRYSDGPLINSGNGNTAWSPSNVFVFPSSVLRHWPTSSGLIVLTSSDIYIIQGTNTPTSPLFATPFLQNIGLLSYDAFAVNGSIIYMYTTDNQVISLDPSSGVSEIGFPIGDQFGPQYGTGTFTPTSTHVTWHIAQSQDKGLYVSDFQSSWWRMCPTPSPESGITWSPRAQIASGFSAVQSVETTPGIHNLLLGPTGVSGTIADVQVVYRQAFGVGPHVYVTIITLTAPVPTSSSFSFSGLTTYTTLNGQTLPVVSGIPYGISTSADQFCVLFGSATYGPATDTGGVIPPNSKILQRNYQVYSDNGAAYPAWAVLGSLVLAQPGQLAMVESFTTDSVAIGTPIALAVQLDEISSYTGIGSLEITIPGIGYAVGDLVSIPNGVGGIYKVTSITGAGPTGPVNGLTVVAPGENYPLAQGDVYPSSITGSGSGLAVNTTSGGLFEVLDDYVQDPTQTEPSITLYAQRFYLSQTQLPAVCRHLQILINWGTDTVRNELLSLSLYGGYEQEK
jgi:hypothetical protein